MSDNPKILQLEDRPDPMGRPCYEKGDGTYVVAPPNDEHLQIGGTFDSWNNNYVQFARLISEIVAEGVGEEMWDGLLNQMGLESDYLSELFDRAQDVFEREKQVNFGAEPRWVVQHEFDGDPTYIIDKVNDPDGLNAIEFPASLHWRFRKFAAGMLTLILNTDGRYCHPDSKGLYDATDAVRTEPQDEPN